MNPLAAGAIAFATDPSPNPTEGTLRPGLETWEVSPGLIGFVVTFALALACVLLFLNMSKHLRRAGHNAREQGIPVAAPKGIGFRRAEDDAPAGDGAPTGAPDGSGASGTAAPSGSSDDSPSAGDSRNGGGSGG